jgi:hypothetical protein
MRASESGKSKRKLTPLGWILSIIGMILAVLLYFVLGIDSFFLDLDGELGLSGDLWAVIGGIIWIFVIMAVLTPILLKFGTKSID